MSAPEAGQGPVVDEFDWIAESLRPLTFGAPEAFDLLDDAAAIPARPGFDLIVSKDAVVEGVHFLPDDPPDLVAGKLLRVNLSDLAAKGAEPYAYFMAIAWPARFGWPERRAFAAGLRADQERFGLLLLGGDTTSTPGPLTASVTILGWVPAGAMVRRSGARAGDVLLVSGTIGDGRLGLDVANGGLADLGQADRDHLLGRYRSPQPRLGLGEPLRRWARAACDVSDGLLADSLNLADAGGLGVHIDLDRLPLSGAGEAWLAGQTDPVAGRVMLATGGDDYEVVCAAAPDAVEALKATFAESGAPLTEIGVFIAGGGLRVSCAGRAVEVNSLGYRHR
jgi:thiamine-monophosphate kinase